MSKENENINPGEKENNQDMGLPKKVKTGTTSANQNESLPSDGPVSEGEGSEAPQLTMNLFKEPKAQNSSDD